MCPTFWALRSLDYLGAVYIKEIKLSTTEPPTQDQDHILAWKDTAYGIYSLPDAVYPPNHLRLDV